MQKYCHVIENGVCNGCQYIQPQTAMRGQGGLNFGQSNVWLENDS